MAEIKRLVKGFTPGTAPAARWRELAARKLVEIDEMVQRAERMRVREHERRAPPIRALEDCSVLLDAAATGGEI